MRNGGTQICKAHLPMSVHMKMNLVNALLQRPKTQVCTQFKLYMHGACMFNWLVCMHQPTVNTGAGQELELERWSTDSSRQ